MMMSTFLTQVSRYLRRYRFGLVLGTIVSSFALALLLSRPAQAAYAVQFLPSNPELGDTIAVVVTGAETAPTVIAAGQSYDTYDIGAGRYRAMIPTSPVTSPGRMDVRVEGDQGIRNVTINIRNRNFQTQYIRLSPGRAGLEGTEYEFRRMAETKALRTLEKYWDGPMVRPSGGRVSSVYGLRRYYNGVFAEDY